MSSYLTTASNEFEADVILGRLALADVRAWQEGTLGPRAGMAGARDIYVEPGDFERARDVLREALEAGAELSEGG